MFQVRFRTFDALDTNAQKLTKWLIYSFLETSAPCFMILPRHPLCKYKTRFHSEKWQWPNLSAEIFRFTLLTWLT
jgi:hypothetical protein